MPFDQCLVLHAETQRENNSRDNLLAFSTANPGPVPQSAHAAKPWGELNSVLLVGLYLTANQFFEELVVNAMVVGDGLTMAKLDGKTCTASDLVRLRHSHSSKRYLR